MYVAIVGGMSCRNALLFNTNGIVYDNSPWHPGSEVVVDRPISEQDERKFKNVATKITSNGVELLVKDKNANIRPDQRKLKLMHMTSMMPQHQISLAPQKSLLTSAVATFVNRQHMSALFPIHQLMQHNYIIKTCMTTYTYLTTVVHNKRSAISTFETILSVITTESLANPYATALVPEIKPTKTKYADHKTIQPSAPSNLYASNYHKIEKRIDNELNSNFDLIEPSEPGHTHPCTTSCSCSHTKTEGLKTKYTNGHHSMSGQSKYGTKTATYGSTKLDLRPTKLESLDKKTQYGPYEYESSQLAPTDRIVEKYTEVISDYSDEKDSNSVEVSELLTNEQAPAPPNNNKLHNNKTSEKPKPKPQKPNKNKVLVADLLKLGSLGIKGLSQLAPVIEKMTGGFMKRQDINKTTTTSTTTDKPQKLTAYHVNKRIDSDIDSKQSNFPIYIPVDELETAESQLVFTNATLHQNLAWAVEHKQPKAHIIPPKMVHESPLVNGGIPISPGEIITANSDVIVGKPAVGGPLTLAASGFKLHNPVNPPPIDSLIAGNEQYFIQENPNLNEQTHLSTKVDDSFDLRPPELPKPNRNPPRPSTPPFNYQNSLPLSLPHPRLPPQSTQGHNEYVMKTEHIKTGNTILGNHGRPAFLDYIPSLGRPTGKPPRSHVDYKLEANTNEEIPDNSPSSSEVINMRVTSDGKYVPSNSGSINKPLLVDIQPSRVANVIIPHGSATALVFAGSSEPHKTGEYIDDPLPYPEPGYFGSFSIDAPQMTNVHNVGPTSNKHHPGKTHHPQPELYKTPPHKDQQFRNELKFKWKDNKIPIDFNKLPPPTSNQETHVQVGPEITVYNPDIYNPNNGDFEKFKNTRGHNKNKDGKEIIDKEYEKYLAVPPPPRPKMHYNQENQQFENKNKPYNQRPIVHVQPVQDMKVFLNIQHPVPDAPKPDPLPPKVTSEIYFAAQAPNSKPSPTYTIQIPPAAPSFGNLYTNEENNINKNHYQQNAPSTPNSNSFPAIPPPNYTNKPTYSDDVNINDKDNTYTVTLNTATNVASNVGETGQVVGSSVPVAIGNIDQLNADIPIGTNFAIKVEDSNPSIDSYNLQNTRNQPVVYDENGRVPPVGDNRWNMSTSEYQRPQYETTVNGDNFYNQYLPQKPTHINVIPPKTEIYKPKQEVVASGSSHHKQRVPEKTEYVNKPISIPPSKNSHANFPMLNEETTHSQNDNDIKPVTEVVNELKPVDPKRPAKLIPNYPTNSHGWYSSILQNEGAINNIKVEATSRKTIPLLPEYNKDPVLDFGQKVHNVGKPPSGYWNQNIGKPFTNPSTQRPTSSITTFNTKPSQPDYLYFGGTRQPVYDIPVRDNSDETTTVKTKPLTPVKETVKPVFENSEEIYDGEDDNNFDGDGEVSQESMKVPVITSSNEESSVKPKPDITLIKEEVKYQDASKTGQNDKQGQLVEFNPGTQTEKPFGSNNKTQTFQSNTIRPIYNMKPRPFTINSGVLDHQLQQPHWQINQLQVNSTNVSYEENLDLNIGEEMGSGSTTRPSSTPSHRYPEYDSTKYRRPQRPIFSMSHNKTRFGNESNIITSTVQINDKKPLIVEDVQEQSTSTPISLTTLNFNQASSEIMDLSPPPATIDYSFKPSTNDEMIMGMSPPPRTPSSIRPPIRTQPTPRPLPIRTPSPYRTKPPRTLPPRVSTTPRPARRPINRDEVSTYRPSYDILNNIRRPSFNQNQPSSHLLPPPREIPSKIITPFNELPSPTVSIPSVPNVVFPTPISSGWLTSSGVGFSSSFDFAPTSVLFPDASTTSRIPDSSDVSSTENSFSYDIPSSSEQIDEVTSEKPVTEDRILSSKETTTEPIVYYSSSEETNVSDSVSSESSHEDATTDKMKVVPIPSKNRTRKPYNPHRHEDKKTTPKYRLPSRPPAVTRPTKVTRPDNLYPSQTRNIVRPVPTRPSLILPTRIIESSESSIDDDIIRPTEVFKDSVTPTVQPELTSSVSNNIASIVTPSLDDVKPTIQPTHHAGNEVKISDEVVPTKTEFMTTVVTLTKTLSEPPKTVSSIGYVNLTHTLTVTHTKTSLVSQSEGAITQTLVLTNTHTSTIVDVITEIHTQVQPTTIIETVTKHIPNIGPTPVQDIPLKTKTPLDDITMSSEENDNLIIKDGETTENTHKVETESEGDNETFFVVMNKSQNGGKAPPITTDIDTGEYDITRNEQVNNNGVSQVLFGEILLAGTPFLETTNVVNPTGFGKECQPDCKASRNERCQRIDGVMKCVCRPGFARMFPDRPCKPTYTYSVKLALGSQGSQRLQFHEHLADNSSKQYHALAVATHEGINRMVMQSDLRDVYHGVHITGFHPVEMKKDGEKSYQGVMNDFYVQLSDNAHESRLKEVIEKYLRNNNYSLGGTDVHAASELVDRLDVSDFDECTSGQFHDCSEHAQCFNLRGTYTCSCQEGFADLSVNTLYPGRVCSAEPVGCERCNYHGACYSRDDRRVLCECFQWYAGGSCQINLKVVLISLVVCGVAVVAMAAVCAALACRPRARPQRSVVACIQAMPALHQGAMPSKRADRRALISDRGDSGDASSIQNASLPYMPTKMQAPRPPKKHSVAPPPAHDPPPPPAPAVMIPRARLHPHHSDSRENISRKKSMEMTSVSEAKLISYLESGAAATNEEMRRKHSMESSYSMSKDKHNKQGALISAGFKVSTTIRPDESNVMIMRDDRDDMSSVNKADLEAELAHLDALRKCYSQEDLSEWTDAERRIGELTLSEARSVGGTLPASTGRAASSTRLTHQEANTMAERDLGSTFLLPHVHLYKPDLTSDVSEFDSL